MSDIFIERTHSFDFLVARQKAQAWLEYIQKQMNISATYHQGDTQDTATFEKSGVRAKATLDAHTIRFCVDLNFLAKPFKNKIIAGIEEGLARFFV